MSKAGAGVAPTRSVSSAAIDGVCTVLLMVETITAPSCEPSMPARSMASFAAVSARSTASLPSETRARVMMPVRCRIHSSEESMGPTSSSFGTRRSPRAAPTDRMREPLRVGRLVIFVMRSLRSPAARRLPPGRPGC